MAGRMEDKKLRCSFCNKTQEQVRKLIAGPNGAYICNECVDICSEIIEDELDDTVVESPEINLLKPREIKKFFYCSYKMMIGQSKRREIK